MSLHEEAIASILATGGLPTNFLFVDLCAKVPA